MVNVRKRDGRIEEFSKEKVASGCQKAGADLDTSSRVSDEVEQQVAGREEVNAREIGQMVIEVLKKYDPSAAKTFEDYFNEHWGMSTPAT